MGIPKESDWITSTKRWWAKRSPALTKVDTAIGLYNLDKTHERFIALAQALRAWMVSKDDWKKSTRNTGLNENAVAKLVAEIAGSEYLLGARHGTDEGALAAYFRTAANDSDNIPITYNREFLTDPQSFLEKYSVYCYNKEDYSKELATYDLTGTQVGGRKALGFEFVRAEKFGTQVCLKISPAEKGGDDVIEAGWIPYNGQSKEPKPDTFGHLAILSHEYNFIFTVGLGGCRIAVVRADTGVIHMYHEPTQAAWGKDPVYDGELLGYFSPNYDHCSAGFCCFQKHPALGWLALIQEFKVDGVKLKVQELGL